MRDCLKKGKKKKRKEKLSDRTDGSLGKLLLLLIFFFSAPFLRDLRKTPKKYNKNICFVDLYSCLSCW